MIKWLRQLFERAISWRATPANAPTPSPFQAQGLKFIGEQDGPSERDLKSALVQLFQDEQLVLRAYLAKVAYPPDETVHVGLFLSASPGSERSLVDQIGSIFRSMFVSGMHLDIAFLRESDELSLQQVCEPFYVDSTNRRTSGSGA